MHVIYTSDFYIDLERWLIYLAVNYRNLTACRQLRRDLVDRINKLRSRRPGVCRQKIPSESGEPLYVASVANGYFQMVYRCDKPSRTITILRLLHCE